MALCKHCRGRGWHSLGIYGFEPCEDCPQDEPEDETEDLDDSDGE